MKNYKKLYEELRQAIDGGYALATHEDALEIIRKRTHWVGLTSNELNDIFDSFKTWNSFQITDVYFAIEAKLKEKNNG
jgi:hypothetical protein